MQHRPRFLALPGLFYDSHTLQLVLQSILRKSSTPSWYLASFRLHSQSLYYSKEGFQHQPDNQIQPDALYWYQSTSIWPETTVSRSYCLKHFLSLPLTDTWDLCANKQTWRQTWWTFYLSQESFHPSFPRRHSLILHIKNNYTKT